MFDIGWSEMAIIMLLALIIIGPRDLPRVARTIGQWVRKGRMLAREFQHSLDDMVRETELDDVKKEIEKAGRTDFKKAVENTIDPKGELTKAFETNADDAKTKPALTDDSSSAAQEKPAKAAANGHADDATATATPSAKPVTSKKAESASAKKPATASKPKKPAAKAATGKTTASKKPASTSKKPARSASSTAKPRARRSTAKPRVAESASGDEGGGADQAVVAAKPS